jgi:hypothetical protein
MEKKYFGYLIQNKTKSGSVATGAGPKTKQQNKTVADEQDFL